MVLKILGFIIIEAAAGVAVGYLATKWGYENEIKKIKEKARQKIAEQGLEMSAEINKVISAWKKSENELKHVRRCRDWANEELEKAERRLKAKIGELERQEYQGRKIGDIFKENDKLRYVTERHVENLETQIKNCKYGLTVSEGSEYTRMLIELEAFDRLKRHIEGQIPDKYKEEL